MSISRPLAAIPLLATLATGCVNRYDPPEWLQGTWHSREPPTYIEWEFTLDNVFFREVHNGEVLQDFDHSKYGFQETFGEGSYALTSPLNEDTHDYFYQTEDPDGRLDPGPRGYSWSTPYFARAASAPT